MIVSVILFRSRHVDNVMKNMTATLFRQAKYVHVKRSNNNTKIFQIKSFMIMITYFIQLVKYFQL